MDGFGWPEALIILAVVLIVFGAGKLPTIGRDLGKSIREFRNAKEGAYDEESKAKGDIPKEVAEVSTKANQG